MKKINLSILFFIMFFSCYSQEKVFDIPSANNKFAFDLYENVKIKNENVLFSPFSISSAFAMTYAGAKENTATEIKNVLHYLENSEAFHSDFGEIFEQTQKKGFTDDEAKIYIANSLWAQKDYEFLKPFIKNAENNYSAEVKNVDFVDAKNREKARMEINSWVEDNTNSKIKDLIVPNVLDDLTRLVLVNALYFSCPWETKFSDAKTAKFDFYNSGKTAFSTDFMNNSIKAKYFENDDLKIIEIPFVEKNASMIILLPVENKGLKNLEKQLNLENYELWISKLEYKQVDLFLPKFTLEESFDLNDVLISMGMVEAFGNNADFSGMTATEDLKISKVIHKAFIQVEEKGVEAAAATAVVMSRKSGGVVNNEVTFKANHPFIFIIKENTSGAILFLGALENIM